MKIPKEVVAARQEYADILLVNAERPKRYSVRNDTVFYTILLAAKNLSRAAKKQVFNGFVLHQKSAEEDEFVEFLSYLKENVESFPAGTRLQLAVLTSYFNEHVIKILDTMGIRLPRGVYHWTAVDILVNNGHVQSFVLDAATAASHCGIHAELKSAFPTGRHYVFSADTIQNPRDPDRVKLRTIQSDGDNCGTFTSEHLRQVSEIKSLQLYDELKQVANADGEVFPQNFVEGLALNRIFRPTQSWLTLESLPEVMSTLFKPGKTVRDAAEERSVIGESGRKRNETIAQKRLKHYDKVSDFLRINKDKEEVMVSILEHRSGFTFVKNPILFQLREFLSKSSLRDYENFVIIFRDFLRKSMAKEHKESLCGDAVNAFINKLSVVDDDGVPEILRQEFTLALASLFNDLDANKSIFVKKVLHRVLSRSMDLFPVLSDLAKFEDKLYQIKHSKETDKIWLIQKETSQFKKAVKAKLWEHFGKPGQGTEGYPRFAAAYRLAKKQIRLMEKSFISHFESLRVTPVEDLVMREPADSPMGQSAQNSQRLWGSKSKPVETKREDREYLEPAI